MFCSAVKSPWGEDLEGEKTKETPQSNQAGNQTSPERFSQPPEASFAQSSEMVARSVNSEYWRRDISLESLHKVEVLIIRTIGTISKLRKRRAEKIRPGSWNSSKIRNGCTGTRESLPLPPSQRTVYGYTGQEKSKLVNGALPVEKTQRKAAWQKWCRSRAKAKM